MTTTKNQAIRSQPFLPVLDVIDPVREEVAVLGFASSETYALRMARAHADKNGYDCNAVSVEPVERVSVSYDPTINSRQKADRAHRAGRGWMVRWNI